MTAAGVPPPIARRGDRGPVPASCAQQRLWFLDQLEGPSPLYNIPRVWRIQGALDHAALERALDELVRRHEAVRTNIRAAGGAPMQYLSPPAPVPLEVRRFDDLPAAARLDQARAFIEEQARRPFRLDAGLLVRASLAVIDRSERLLLIVQHHIASDGWSLGVLGRELSTLYEAALDNIPAPLDEPPVQYSDYSEWQRNWLESGVLDGSLDFWKRRLAGTPEFGFPTDFPRPAAPGSAGEREPFRIPPHLAAQVARAALARGATPFMILLAAWLAVLARHTGTGDMAVGTAVAGRWSPELEPLIGLFVNTVVLRVPIAGNPDFWSLVETVKARCTEAMAHQAVPFERIVEALSPERAACPTPLVQTLFALQNTPGSPLRLRGAVVLEERVSTGTAKADLSLLIEPEGNAFFAELEYSTELFRRETVRRLSTHYLRALEHYTEHPREPVFDAPLLSAAERRQALLAAQGPARAYPQTSIAAVFESQAAATPGAAAVSSDSVQWSYRELNECANRIAHALIGAGAAPGTAVGLLLERSPLSVAAMLAVLKTGAGYLPLSPRDPPHRLRFQVRDSAVSAVAGCAATRPLFEALGAGLPWVSVDGPELGLQPAADPEAAASPGDLAYINYTSGSTGMPKAVRIPHRGVLRLVFGQDYARFSPEEVFLHFAPPAFDAATLEVWAPLLHGGRCAVWEGDLQSPGELGGFLRRQSVTSAWLTSSFFNLVVDESPEALGGLRQLLIGGEALSPGHVRRALELLPDVRIINGYGPTESTTFACCLTIPRPLPPHWTSIPIGRPIANTQAYVLDAHHQLAPAGAAGELWIGGDGLAMGYSNSPELNEGKFAAVTIDGRPRRLYRTGDRARWLPEGVLEFQGRYDHQVKVRGFRVELGEIEAVLASHPMVRAACVLAIPDGQGSSRLAAFVARRPGSSLQASALAAHLSQRLPPFMIPAPVRVLDELPLAANGKVDRGALALADEPAASFPEAPSAFETRLARIWAETLPPAADPPGRKRSFFEVGGHSLLALRLMARVEKEFGVRLSVASLFQAPTIAAMASMIENRSQTTACVFPIQPEGSLPAFFWVAASPVFLRLASRLSPQRPFFGLAAPVNAVTSGVATFEERAGSLVAAIRERQPEGPYLLGGWCLAGVLAYEIAQQLERAGAVVQLVVLVDAPNPAARRAWFDAAPRRRWLHLIGIKTGFHLGEMTRMRRAAWPRYVAARFTGLLAHRKASRLPGGSSPIHDATDPDVPLDYDRAFLQQGYAYTPLPIRARVLQVRAVRRPRGGWFSAGFGWEKVAPQMDVAEVPGNHVDMLTLPRIDALADEINRRLAEP